MAAAKEVPKGTSEYNHILNYIEELREFWKDSPELLPEDENGQKDLLVRLKRFLIGTKGRAVQRMQKDSGARISHRDKKVVISGSQEQTCYAIKLLREKIREFASKSEEVDLKVTIQKNCKGPVMGRRRENLVKFRERGNLYLYRSHGDVHVRAKNKREAQLGALAVQTEAVKGRRRKETKKGVEERYCFVDDMNLEDDAELKLDEYTEKGDANNVSNNESLFVLNVYSDSRKELTNVSVTENFKCSDIVQETVRKTLEIIKSDSANDANTWIDLWAHFGQVVIRGVQEADEGEMINLEGARGRLDTKSRNSTKWKTRFREGINIKDSFWKSSSCEFQKDLTSVFRTRIDLNIITPTHRSLRFKVWIAHPDFEDNINEVPLPNDDFQSVIGEVEFTDARTQAMCKGWLCTETEQPLKVDVILPALHFSFRYGIRKGSFYTAKPGEEEEEDKILLNYLGTYTRQDKEPFFVHSEEQLPKGFSVTYERLSHRTLYRQDNFTVTVSNEESWTPCRQTGTSRATCDLHVRNTAWEEAFQTDTWEPQDIAQGIPDFLKQLKIFVNILNRELLREGEETQ